MSTKGGKNPHRHHTFFADASISLVGTFTATWILVKFSTAVWATFGIGAVLATFKLSQAARTKSSSVKWEKGFTDWFIVAKSLTSAAGVICMNIFREKGWYSQATCLTTNIFMGVNIFEAIARDVESKFYANAAVGLFLIFNLPWGWNEGTSKDVSLATIESKMFLFPISWAWVLLYTSWNACFVYGDNLSWQTRLILIPPILIAAIVDVRVWLGARVLLLLLHILLRSVQIVRIYTPGESILTPVAGSISNSKRIATVWGCLNIFVAVLWYTFEYSIMYLEY